MKKDVHAYIEDIRDCVMKIEEYANSINEKNFLENKQVQDVIIGRLGEIGDAVKNIPRELKSKYPEVPWKKIAGMKDMLINRILRCQRFANPGSYRARYN